MCRLIGSIRLLAASVCLLALIVPSAHAQSLGMDIYGTDIGPPGSDFTGGYSFSVSSAIDVTALAFFDQNGDGLQDDHDIGLWNSTGSSLLASATIATGTGAPTVPSVSGQGVYRTIGIPTLLLNPGTYVIGATLPGGTDEDFFAGTMVPAAGITFGVLSQHIGSGLSFPEMGFPGNGGYIGPSFLFTPAAVPEPSSLALLLVSGFGGAGFLLKRRR